MTGAVYGYGFLILTFLRITFIKIHTQCNAVVLIAGYIRIRTRVTVATYKTSTQKWIEM